MQIVRKLSQDRCEELKLLAQESQRQFKCVRIAGLMLHVCVLRVSFCMRWTEEITLISYSFFIEN